MKNLGLWCGVTCTLIICFMFSAIVTSGSLLAGIGCFVLGVVCCLIVVVIFLILHNREVATEIRIILASLKDWHDTERIAEEVVLARLRSIDWSKEQYRRRLSAAEYKDRLFGKTRRALVHQLEMLERFGLVERESREVRGSSRDFWRLAPASGPGRGPWGRRQ